MSDTAHRKRKTEAASRPFSRKWIVLISVLVILGVLPVLACMAFLGYEFIIQLPKAQQTQAQLEIEYKAIPPLPNASLVSYDVSHKTSQALVDGTYLTDASFSDILNYYDMQLKQQGWQYHSTTDLKDWGRDLGGKSVEYCKGDYVATLQYAGQLANYGWTYAFDVSWGLGGCK